MLARSRPGASVCIDLVLLVLITHTRLYMRRLQKSEQHKAEHCVAWFVDSVRRQPWTST